MGDRGRKVRMEIFDESTKIRRRPRNAGRKPEGAAENDESSKNHINAVRCEDTCKDQNGNDHEDKERQGGNSEYHHRWKELDRLENSYTYKV